MANTYVIYYGWLIEDDSGTPREEALRIANAKVPLLIAHCFTHKPVYVNLSAQVLALMKDAGTEVFGYVSTEWAARPLHDALQSTRAVLDAGVDGIFFDEAPYAPDGSAVDYYRKLADAVHARGKRVIVNPGMSRCDACYMAFADLLMAEHQWRRIAQDSTWTSRYSADRFMGVSSNVRDGHGNLPMGYELTLQRGVADTREAWTRGIGWHTSTDVHVNLPAWFESYVAAVDVITPPASPPRA